jgi:beta-xylosidase
MYVSTPFGATNLNAAVIHGRPGAWSGASDVLPNLPLWAVRQFTWTPAVYPFGNHFVMYFSSVARASGLHCIGVALSNSPLGPFTSSSPAPIVCHPEHGGDIDAQLFTDPTGPNGPANPLYLIWKSDNNSIHVGLYPEFLAQGLTNDGMSVTGQPTAIYWPRQPWQYSLLEAPQMVKDPNGRLWLFYSGGGIFNAPTYAMGYAECDSPMGPCHDTTTVPLLGSNEQGVGPGEETVFVGPDGSTWLLYNPWYAGQIYRWVRPAEAARIVWTPSGPSLGIPAGQFPDP